MTPAKIPAMETTNYDAPNAQATSTWILVANRGGARLFGTEAGMKGFHAIKDFSHSEGRLKNHDLVSDRSGTTKAEAGANYPVHGLSNKELASRQETTEFARELARCLNQGRAKGEFTKLILVASAGLLGSIRASLDGRTAACLVGIYDKNFTGVGFEDVERRLREMLLFSSEGTQEKSPVRANAR